MLILEVLAFYTLQGNKFPRVRLKFVVLRLLTRELTGKLNREHYNSCGSWKVLNIWTGNFDIIFKFNSLAQNSYVVSRESYLLVSPLAGASRLRQ